ncbi:MAG: cbb3-type cytochrome c oxidase N-terminal domain-containing protein [Saprospiraceae bacterium]
MSSYRKNILLLVLSIIATPSNAAVSNSSFTEVLNQYPFEFYGLLAVCLLELVIIWILAKALLGAMGHNPAVVEKGKKEILPVQVKGLLQRINDYLISDKGDEVDLKHDYDGISELDNKTPQWWIVAFYCTILFGVIYSYRMFVSGTMPRQITELNAEIDLAKKSKKSQLVSNHDNIDESSVVALDDDNKFKGSLIFGANCVACHGQNGEGNVVGPNLTDDYWLHKGDIKDIFYSIKYGYVEKGMKSWSNDFSPLQIAQLATYVKSLKGSNPPNAKAKQGDLYRDSTLMIKDSLTLSNKK